MWRVGELRFLRGVNIHLHICNLCYCSDRMNKMSIKMKLSDFPDQTDAKLFRERERERERDTHRE